MSTKRGRDANQQEEAKAPPLPDGGPWAHSANVNGEWHDLREHLWSVAAMARGFAEIFGGGDWAYAAGLAHDVGKASEAFQAYLRDSAGETYHGAELRGSVDHTSAAAQHLVAAVPILGHLLAYPVAGHHAGLLDAISEGPCLERRLTKTVEPWERGLELIPPLRRPRLPPFLERALSERGGRPKETAFAFAFFTRMIFSCLVDADFLDTEAFIDSDRAARRRTWPNDVLDRMEEALDQFVAELPTGEGSVERARCDVRRACMMAANAPPGMFSLTVPTGGGKTLSSLAFALRHARVFNLRRTIYVAPFTSIIEQNAAVFRGALEPLLESGLPDPVVEHHSTVDLDATESSARLAAENWDAPLVVTTSVQLYESLFAARPGRCRKLHNLSGAVIILDEAQKLPVDLLEPCLMALRELTDHYHATVVLCTATKPAVQRRPGFAIGLEGVREIVLEPRSLYIALKRVDVVDLGRVSDEDLCGRLREKKQALCIVNTRRHAREVYQRLADADGTVHLSAAMCPEHRALVFRGVHRRLQSGDPCRVISTQLIEAGVDVDFPVVFRSLAGLDSVAQAAGRCNRNGRLDRGITYLFRSEHGKRESFLRDTANATEQLLGGGMHPPLYPDMLSLDAVEHYFRLYYWDQRDRWDARHVLSEMNLGTTLEMPFLFNFRTISERFHLIDDSGETVFVPWGDRGRKLCAALRNDRVPLSTELLRGLQRFGVQVPRRHLQRALGGCVELVRERFPTLSCLDPLYDPRLGLVLDGEGLSSETLVC
jgi:CRISPR-associated endonuclease/helicase Cas3